MIAALCAVGALCLGIGYAIGYGLGLKRGSRTWRYIAGLWKDRAELCSEREFERTGMRRKAPGT